MKRSQTSGKRKASDKTATLRRSSQATPPEFPLGGAKLVARPSFILPEPPVPQPPSAFAPIPSRSLFRSRPRIEYTNTYEDLLEALAAEKVQITLGNDILAKDSIVINHDVAIDFNGHSIISDRSVNDMRLLDIRRGEVTLTGEGKIFVMGSNGVAIRLFGAISSGMPNYTNLTIDEKIHLYAPEGSGILISPNLGAAYGVNLNFRGEIVARSGICLSQGVRGLASTIPEIHIKSGARIIADEVGGAAIEAAGVGTWHIGAVKLFGINGLRVRHGSITIDHAQIISTDAAIQIDDNAATGLNLEIDGGKYISETNFAVTGSPLAIENFIIKSGDFCGVRGAIADELSESISVWEESFSNDVPAMLQSLAPDSDWNLTFTQEIPSADESILETSSPVAPIPEPAFEDDSAPATPVAVVSSSVAESIKPEPSFPEADEISSIESFADEFELSDEPIIDDEPDPVIDEINEEIEDNIENFVMIDDEDDFEFPDEVSLTDQSSAIGQRSVFALPEPIHTPTWTPPPAPAPIIMPPLAPEPAPIYQPEPASTFRQPEPEAYYQPESFSVPNSDASMSPELQYQYQPAINNYTYTASAEESNAISQPDDAERDALRSALELAISDMRSLRAEDYESGYDELARAVVSTEMLLSDPDTSLTEILDATTDLLDALDQLVEGEDSTMTDAELDQLFYHGAVLKEAAKTHQPEPEVSDLRDGELYNASGSQPDNVPFEESYNFSSPQSSLNFSSEPSRPLTSPSDYQLANHSIPPVVYQPVYQPKPQSAYNSQISQYTANRLRMNAQSAADQPASTSSRSPFIDESNPTERWSTGVTAIDEASPYAYERFHQGHYTVRRQKSGLGKFFKGVSAGFHAGLDAFHKTRHSLN